MTIRNQDLTISILYILTSAKREQEQIAQEVLENVSPGKIIAMGDFNARQSSCSTTINDRGRRRGVVT